jgi:hypothetical protein
MDPGFKTDWNIFLALEVGYFYPLRKNRPLPGHPGHIGVLLSDRDHLAVVIGDGDGKLAQKYIGKEYGTFWDAIVPQECTLPYSTVKTRIERGLTLLATALNQAETAAAISLPASKDLKDVLMEKAFRIDEWAMDVPRNDPGIIPAPPPPMAIPDQWEALVNQAIANPRILLHGGSRLAGKPFLSFLSSKLRLMGMEPAFTDLFLHAAYAHEKSLFCSFALLALPSRGLLDLFVDTELERKCIEANAQGRLVLFADGIDDVPKQLLPRVLWQLAAVKRIIIPSRIALPFLTDMATIPTAFLW